MDGKHAALDGGKILNKFFFEKLLDKYIALRYSIYRSTSIAVRYIAVHKSGIK